MGGVAGAPGLSRTSSPLPLLKDCPPALLAPRILFKDTLLPTLLCLILLPESLSHRPLGHASQLAGIHRSSGVPLPGTPSATTSLLDPQVPQGPSCSGQETRARIALCLWTGSLVISPGGSFSLPTLRASTGHDILPLKTFIFGGVFWFGKSRRLGVLWGPSSFPHLPQS